MLNTSKSQPQPKTSVVQEDGKEKGNQTIINIHLGNGQAAVSTQDKKENKGRSKSYRTKKYEPTIYEEDS